MSRLEKLFDQVLPDHNPPAKDTDKTILVRIEDSVPAGKWPPGLKNKIYHSRNRIDLTEKPDDKFRLGSGLHPLIQSWANLSDFDQPTALYLDTETTGLSGGAGIFAFLVGTAYLQNHTLITDQYFLMDPVYEPEFLNLLSGYFSRFSTVITFNGKSYDMNLLSRRFRFHSITWPLPSACQIDLLHLSRRLWKGNLPDCSLQQIERSVLNIRREGSQDIPGSLIPKWYFDFLRTRNVEGLPNILYHNRQDVHTMVELLVVINRILHDISSTKSNPSRILNLLSVAGYFNEYGFIKEAIKVNRYLLSAQPGNLKAMMSLSMIFKQQGKWGKAREYWLSAADGGNVFACIELAKQAEHQEKNYTDALNWAVKALDLLDERSPQFIRFYDEIIHRIHRIQKKIDHRQLLSRDNGQPSARHSNP